MIKLILQAGNSPDSFSYEKTSLIIGSAATADLILNAIDAAPEHLQIQQQGDLFFALNLAQDPFTTLNGRPFGKKQIVNGAILQIGDWKANFYGEPQEICRETAPTVETSEQVELPQPATQPQQIEFFATEESANPAVETSKLTEAPTTASTAEVTESVDRSAQLSSLTDSEMADLLRQVEAFEEEASAISYDIKASAPITPAALPIEPPPSPITAAVAADPALSDDAPAARSETNCESELPESYHEQREPQPTPQIEIEELSPQQTLSQPHAHQSLKDYYLREFDEETELEASKGVPHSAPPASDPQPLSWRPLLTIAAGLTAFIALLLAFAYISLNDRSEEEEIKAAAAVADIVMALNFAQINHTLPQNQNWSDPDFLKNNLAAILASEYAPLANVDWHGQLENAPYILRIYTGSDLSHFLVIAQPHASLSQWLIPKATIIVDSQSMELRKTADLKILNRLLVNPTLDSSNQIEIANFVQHAQVIPLAALQRNLHKTGFVTPKALAFMRPGAENLIYNAMRYYHLGESFTRKAIRLYESSEDHLDIALFMDELRQLQKFPNAVLYSAEGLKTAALAQRAVSTFSPQAKFLFAYLQFDSKGMASGSHLLIDDISSSESKGPIAWTDEMLTQRYSDDQLRNPRLFSEQGTAQGELKETSSSESLDDILVKLYLQRQKHLNSLAAEINGLIADDSHSPVANFPFKLHLLRTEYAYFQQRYQQQIVTLISLVAIEDLLENNRQRHVAGKGSVDRQDQAAEALLVDQSHPLYYKLTAVAHSRMQTLKPAVEALRRLLNSEHTTPETLFWHQWEALMQHYRELAVRSDAKVAEEIAHLQHEYSKIGVTHFMEYVAAAGLELFVQKDSHEEPLTPSSHGQLRAHEIEEAVAQIRAVNTLPELHTLLSKTYSSLTMEKIHNPSLLIAFQNTIRSEVTEKLNLLILSSNSPLRDEAQGSFQREAMEEILRMAWINDRDESDYYLNEFDFAIH
jgi:hypothetical protein